MHLVLDYQRPTQNLSWLYHQNQAGFESGPRGLPGAGRGRQMKSRQYTSFLTFDHLTESGTVSSLPKMTRAMHDPMKSYIFLPEVAQGLSK